MIPFNRPAYVGSEDIFIKEAISSLKLSGNGPFAHRCQSWFEKSLSSPKTLLTPNATQALEMAALLIDIKPGDEVIMPSYTFVSTANAFVLRGAKIIFVDIRQDTLNIDETLIEQAITSKTKAIVPVHYAGVSCEMDVIMQLAKKYNLYVIEDAAQGMMSAYRGKALGSIGHFGVYSFHESKNYTSGGEGGLLIINDEQFIDRAEIIREKGTNRDQFFSGRVDKYSWVDLGSSYLPSELQAAYLWAQLEKADEINQSRLDSFYYYFDKLKKLAFDKNTFELPFIPQGVKHNAHMFYIKVKDIIVRRALMNHLEENKVSSVFHYIPLHSAKAGLGFGEMIGQDRFTTRESERLLRLPMYFSLSRQEQDVVIKKITEFFCQEKDYALSSNCDYKVYEY